MDITDSNIHSGDDSINLLRAELLSLVNEDWENRAVTIARRKRIRLVGESLLKRRGALFMGERDRYYIGPDVDNVKIIYLAGVNANLAIDQMVRDGKRTSLRRPRVARRVQPEKPSNPYGV